MGSGKGHRQVPAQASIRLDLSSNLLIGLAMRRRWRVVKIRSWENA